MSRFKWMSVRLPEVGGRRLSEPIWVDVFRSEYWEIIARDLPAVGVGRTPQEAWDAFEKCFETIVEGQVEKSYPDSIEFPSRKLIRKLSLDRE